MLHHPLKGQQAGIRPPGGGLVGLFLVAVSVMFAQRTRPDYDPETKDGLLIQHIQQEQDAGEKLHYMEQFAAQYPSHPAVGWVYDQLQPAYFQSKEYDQAMRIGALRLTIEPENLEAASLALRSADAKHDAEQIVKWANRLWQVASAVAARGGANAVQAKQSQDYADFCTYSAATQLPDVRARLELLQSLEQRNPTSQYSHNLVANYFQIYHDLHNEAKTVEMAERGLKSDPDNVDMIMALAEHYFHKETPHDRQMVIGYTGRAIEVMDKKLRPANVKEDEWARKKSATLGMAYYMGGMSSSLNGTFGKADTLLRAALPFIKDNEQEAALLYHLGMANYRLAEKSGERSRPVEALKYMRRCAAMKSPYQLQAQKNVDGIRSEYNLQ